MSFAQGCIYIAVAVSLAGFALLAARWFRTVLFPAASPPAGRGRFVRAAAGALRALVTRPGRWITILVGDVLFQQRTLRQSPTRWAMHQAIFWGMLYLIVFHALDDWTAARLFLEYESTRNPFLMLRNLCGVMVLAGITGALARRTAVRGLRRFFGWRDGRPLLILAVMVLTGFLLEGVRFTSATWFDEMVDAYLIRPEPEEVAALEAFWADGYGVVFPPGRGGTDAAPQILAAGRVIHQESCTFCHSPHRSAAVSFAVARGIRPAARVLDLLHVDGLLWSLHFLSALAGLALLPFDKLSHMVTTPLRLLIPRHSCPADGASVAPAIRESVRAIGLDACTHCGVCTLACSVAPAYTVLGNPAILPSEKLTTLRAYAAGRVRTPAGMAAFSQGSFICTACGRCTRLCPSGIDLQDLWTTVKAELTARGWGELHQRIALRDPAQWEACFRQQPALRSGESGPLSAGLTERPELFWACVQCTTCTNVCPVVAAADHPGGELDLTPQQVMNLMRLQLRELAMGSRMVWRCVTCYKCQEHCPQGVRVTDVILELRNLAAARMERMPGAGRAPDGAPRRSPEIPP